MDTWVAVDGDFASDVHVIPYHLLKLCEIRKTKRAAPLGGKIRRVQTRADTSAGTVRRVDGSQESRGVLNGVHDLGRREAFRTDGRQFEWD